MARSHMLPAVLQAVTLSALATIVSHHLMHHVMQSATSSEVYTNFTTAIDANTNATRATSIGNSILALNGTQFALNATHNATVTTHKGPSDGVGQNITLLDLFPETQKPDEEKSFYFHVFPRSLLVTILLCICNYYWQIWLERCFPGRLKPAELPPSKSSGGDGADQEEPREEAIVQKWIAQGKVKRASLSWWNTLLKWTLDMSLGTLWMQILQYLMDDVVLKWSLRAFSAEKRWWVKWEILIRCGLAFVDIRPLTSLISFIIVPAHQRIVFLAGADLIWTTCFGLIASRIVPWLVSNQYLQEIVKNATDQAIEKDQQARRVMPNEPRLMEEL